MGCVDFYLLIFLFYGSFFNSLLGPGAVGIRFENFIDINCCYVNEFRFNLAWLNNLLNFGNDVFSSCGHVGIEVSRSFIKVKISECISLLSLYKGKIAENSLFFDIFFAIENFDVFRC